MTIGLDGATSWARTAVRAGGLSMLAMDHKLASTFGYLVALPFNFAGNRHFSFRSSNALAGDAGRFLLLHAGNLIVTVMAMGTVVDLLGLHYSAGITVAVILVPAVNFLVMQWWVFRQK